MTIEFTPLLKGPFPLAESPVYDDRRKALWFCNIDGRELHRVSPDGEGHKKWSFPSEVCSLGLANSGKIVIALASEVGLFDPDAEKYARIARIDLPQPVPRLNDGKVGPDGAFWVGTMDLSGRSPKDLVGAIYRVEASGKVEKKIDGLAVSNGLAFSPDETIMYHSDTRGPWIDSWQFDRATGAISDRKRVATRDNENGRPDGGATDAEGGYWSAGVSAARLNRFTATGTLIESYPLPVCCPTMPCFGGDDLRKIFVTSMREGRSDEILKRYPLSGAVLVGRSPVAGAPVSRFRDR